jgi:hypothetical protein
MNNGEETLMSLTVTPVLRNLVTKVTFLYLEFEDLFVILGLAVVMNMFGRFLQREMFGIPYECSPAGPRLSGRLYHPH